MSRRPKGRLHAKLNCFAWREGWQGIVLPGSVLLPILLGILTTLVAPRLVHWFAEDRPPRPVVERDHSGSD
jgi:hypothetical protein